MSPTIWMSDLRVDTYQDPTLTLFHVHSNEIEIQMKRIVRECPPSSSSGLHSAYWLWLFPAGLHSMCQRCDRPILTYQGESHTWPTVQWFPWSEWTFSSHFSCIISLCGCLFTEVGFRFDLSVREVMDVVFQQSGGRLVGNSSSEFNMFIHMYWTYMRRREKCSDSNESRA